MRRTRIAYAKSTGVAPAPVVRKHRPDYLIVLFMGLLMLLGLVVMYAIGPQRANVMNVSHGTDFYTSTYFFVKQAMSLVVAIAAFCALALCPTDILKKYAKQILYVGFGSCVLLFLAGNVLHIHAIAQESLGAYRWFNFGPLGGFQPAEFLKFAILLFLAGFLARRMSQGLINDVDKTLIPAGAMYVLAMLFVVVIQKDMGTGLTLSCVVMSMFMVGGISRKIGARALLVALALGVVMIAIAPHRIARIVTFVEGDKSGGEITDSNYQIQNAKIAIGSGGLFGLGIGNSVQASGYLPEATNDSVFAIMGEIFGFVGLVVVLALFTALLMRLLRVSNHLPDTWMRLVAAGVAGWLASHVIINVAAMLGVFPLTGITLPLLSFGGTSMVFIAGALGLVFQLSRYTTHQDLSKERMTAYEGLGGRRGIGRTRYAGARGAQSAR